MSSGLWTRWGCYSINPSWVWWRTAVIPALRGLRQKITNLKTAERLQNKDLPPTHTHTKKHLNKYI